MATQNDQVGLDQLGNSNDLDFWTAKFHSAVFLRDFVIFTQMNQPFTRRDQQLIGEIPIKG